MFQTQHPVVPPYYMPQDYRTPPHTPAPGMTSTYYSPRQYVYSSTPNKGHSRRATQDAGYTTYKTTYTTSPRKSYYETEPEFSSPGYYSSSYSTPKQRADYVPIYTSTETKSRPRRASGSSKPTHTTVPPRPRSSNSNPTKPPPQATEADARRAGIPAGYSYKNWDPTEEPILLLGSVFDANSLGKWIYDWTVFFFGPATPMTEIAGELWLLLIQLAGKIKRAEETMSRIRQTKSRDMVDDFLDSGERLWQRFNKLLKICENYMWKAAKKESRDAKKVTMGKNSGCEFVDAIFGRDRELERTEKLMTGIRLWSMRFDANVGPILAAPHL
ncbi:hypothetical protein WHR41_03756 [Cladosporium halotolerans]|uniref:Vegetative cell wall protein gp1 n=1 Tax=Cladosporium halotolerans TaxID=1052096 RepID=A0AB34KR42_9PEZI